MVKLGKEIKGRVKKETEHKRVIVKILNQEKTMEELEKEQAILKMKRETLKKKQVEEEKMAHFNRMKILTHWRRIMRVAKTEQLKKDIQVYQQNHDREVDAKDAILQMLDRDLEEADEQYQMALRNHKIRIDQLIDIQNSRLTGLHEEFERDLNILKSEFEQERGDINKGHEMEKRELEDMISTIEEEENAKLAKLKKDFVELRQETKNGKDEELEGMKHELIKKIDLLDQDFEIQFSNYVSETDNKSNDYTEKLRTNDKDFEELTEITRETARLKEIIMNWTLKKQQNSKECSDRNNKLMKEKVQILKHYHELKRKMTLFREDESRRLTNLTKNSKACMDTLKGYQKLAERILTTAELCRKLETEREKVLPFYESDSDTLEEEGKVGSIEGVHKDVYNEFKQLDQFYKRYNKVLLDKIAIEKQKGSLDKENMFFKSLLKQYLDGVSVNNDVMNASNPLLVVNNKVNLNRPPVQKLDENSSNPRAVGNIMELNMEITNINKHTG
ncbi:unnamed protein product [Moneuplotes crassus]|uniref:Dynein regulatory complex subunit 2 n=1 Tax=Euplotes crassus TaxID=5936 RepID=A0AAD1UC96_EUPCR|nr:unnamed protein product [Moneuplotes crassus]